MGRLSDAKAAELLRQELSKPYRDIVAEVLEAGRRLPEQWRQTSMADLVEWMRRRFGLTQRQLALLAGLPHSKIAKIERGQDVQLSTLAQVFAGLGCELVIVPRSPLSAQRLWRRTADLASQGVIPRRRCGG